MYGPAEVCYLEFAPQAHEEVLGLDVPVNDFLTVAVDQRVCQLRDELQHDTTTK